ncbi:MAG: hypothetical protein NC084_02810 [Bacteroides sp.]|nr:hypothetical protein [Eubacterium sp.]MCM1417446.1 hypothetical protein [Roseburia sp.]MCM1461626.1 hypothetical protein [Bacteroides sp.]
MKKGNSPLVNGLILAAVAVLLIVYFTLHSMWNVATVFVLLLVAALSVGQILIYLFFFRDQKK